MKCKQCDIKMVIRLIATEFYLNEMKHYYSYVCPICDYRELKKETT